MKTKYLFITMLLMFFVCLTSLYAVDNQDTLYQVSTIDALLQGVYDGDVTCGELKQQGDFGIGTFQALDGEMVVLDGKVYQVAYSGKVNEMPNEERTPFAAVTPFENDISLQVNDNLTYDELKKIMDSVLPTENIFYAVKITGTFKYMKTRSVPKQEKPYPLLVEVVKDQSVFEFEEVQGTIVGFKCPSFVKGINVPGYHLHFLNKDKTAGGHILEFTTKDITVEIDTTDDFYMELLKSKEFYTLNLAQDQEKELKKVERK